MRRVWLRVVGMAAALAFLAVSAHAATGLFTPLDIAGTYGKALNLDSSYNALAQDPALGPLHLVRANAGLVTETAVSLPLNLGPGLDFRAYRTNSYVTESGSLVWVGVIEDPGTAIVPFTADAVRFDPMNQVILVKSGDTLTGNLHFAGTLYQIRPLKSGSHVIAEVNPAAMPPDHPPAYKRIKTYPMKGGNPLDKAISTIRVMVHYTPSAASASGNISSLIDLAVAESNTGYTNSGVQITLQLATKAQVSYSESGSFSTDLSRYRGTSDGFMDSIHTTRNSVTADVGVLIINNSSSCGLASGIGSSASTAFVAVHWSCATGYYSFAHEIGHLLSARHDPATDPSTSPYTYGHGYRYTGSPDWRTIMAYDCPGGCPRLNYWSSPLRTFNGVPMGTSSQSDNTRVLNTTKATVAAFR
jgi:peptidyl-Asp metalloendopeptidase